VLLVITLLLSYTGYLLPGISLRSGPSLSARTCLCCAARRQQDSLSAAGGNQVNANALLRFYVLHCVMLPLAAILFIAIHFWRIRKDADSTCSSRTENASNC